MDEKQLPVLQAHLIDALVRTLQVPEKPYWEPRKTDDGRVRCRDDVAAYVQKALSDPRGELAPVLIEFFLRRLEPVVSWEVE